MVLALDLGTQLGYVLGNKKNYIKSGVINLKKLINHKDRQPVQDGLYIALNELYKSYKFNAIVVELVRNHGGDGVQTAHFYGALLYVLESWSYKHKKHIYYAEVSTIKKQFTGNGKAKKADIIKSAIAKGFNIRDHNEADAIAIFYLYKNYFNLLKNKK